MIMIQLNCNSIQFKLQTAVYSFLKSLLKVAAVADWLLLGITAPVSGKKTWKSLDASPSHLSLQFWWNSLLSCFDCYQSIPMEISVLAGRDPFYLLLHCCVWEGEKWMDRFETVLWNQTFRLLSSQHSELHHSKLHLKKTQTNKKHGYKQNLICFTSGHLLSLTLRGRTCIDSVSYEVFLEGTDTKEPWILSTAQVTASCLSLAPLCCSLGCAKCATSQILLRKPQHCVQFVTAQTLKTEGH